MRRLRMRNGELRGRVEELAAMVLKVREKTKAKRAEVSEQLETMQRTSEEALIRIEKAKERLV